MHPRDRPSLKSNSSLVTFIGFYLFSALSSRMAARRGGLVPPLTEHPDTVLQPREESLVHACIRPSRSMEPGPVIAWRNGTRCANSGRAAMRRMTAAREIALYALRLYIPYKEQSILPPPQRVCAATVRNATTDPACAPPSGSADS